MTDREIERLRKNLREATVGPELERALERAGAYVDAHQQDDDLEPLLASIHVATMAQMRV